MTAGFEGINEAGHPGLRTGLDQFPDRWFRRLS